MRGTTRITHASLRDPNLSICNELRIFAMSGTFRRFRESATYNPKLENAGLKSLGKKVYQPEDRQSRVYRDLSILGVHYKDSVKGLLISGFS